MLKQFLFIFVLLAIFQGNAKAEIPPPDDAPQPLSPSESIKQATLPPGFRLQLVASEPLIQEASSVCWDSRGRLFVGELHGYNLEGQYDVDELNKTGILDTKVQRIPASAQSKKKAEAGTNGTVKMLIDTNGDGVMDKAELWADKLPPVYGICAAKDGVIVVCAPHIVYIADRDGDGKPDFRETLFTGLATGGLERGVNCPMWYFDNWIYVGRGHRGSQVTGPHLKKTVSLAGSDFRIKPDGTAIEPVTGATNTIGHAVTDWGHRIEAQTSSPAIVAAPLPSNYLARNSYLPIPSLQKDANADDMKVYPTSEVHPWRAKRHATPGYKDVYKDKTETVPNGAYTSSCSPLIYRDTALPGLHGQLFTCEPAQNFIHRTILTRKGVNMVAKRAPGEETSEFLPSKDVWFHPMYLTHAPDGAICIVDFYREIIEDYSAVPRHLQQQYGVVNGQDRGRIYKLVHEKMPKAPPADMHQLSTQELVVEVVGPYFWRRETARRLLIDRGSVDAADELANYVKKDSDVYPTLNVLYTLEGLGKLSEEVIKTGLQHEEASVRIHSLQLADKMFASHPKLFESVLQLANDADPIVLLQFAMSIGESKDPRVAGLLEQFAIDNGNIQFMQYAILSSATSHSSELLNRLLAKANDNRLGYAESLIEPLCTMIAAQKQYDQLSNVLVQIAKLRNKNLQSVCLRGFNSQLNKVKKVKVSADAIEACKELMKSEDRTISNFAKSLVVRFGMENATDRETRLAAAVEASTNLKLPLKQRIVAIQELANEEDPTVTESLLKVFSESTPQIRELVLETLFTRRDQLSAIVDAIEKDRIPVSALNAIQRAAILENVSLKERAEKLFKSASRVDEKVLQTYVDALKQPRNIENGAKVFSEKCANCHQVRGVGFAVGPNLDAEFQRAEETYIKDILAPSDVISAGYVTYVIDTKNGHQFNGLLQFESASSITLKKPRGESQVILRNEIDGNPKASTISLMPENFATELKPADVADVIAWIRAPQTSRVLIDNNVGLLSSLDKGPGKAEFVPIDESNSRMALRITPPQRFSERIPGWEFKIRKNPQAGEYRYITIRWKSDGADCLMVEFATDGKWAEINTKKYRYSAGRNTSPWLATEISPEVPKEWTTVTRDLWKDFGDCTITGMAPTAINGAALFDKIELLQKPVDQ